MHVYASLAWCTLFEDWHLPRIKDQGFFGSAWPLIDSLKAPGGNVYLSGLAASWPYQYRQCKDFWQPFSQREPILHKLLGVKRNTYHGQFERANWSIFIQYIQILNMLKTCWKIVLVQLCLAWHYWIPAPQNRDQPANWVMEPAWIVTRNVPATACSACSFTPMRCKYISTTRQVTSCHSQGTGYWKTKISTQHSSK